MNSDIGKRMLWSDVVDKYPNKWVGMVELELNERGTVEAGILVCIDDKKDSYKFINMTHDKMYTRTTIHHSIGDIEIEFN